MKRIAIYLFVFNLIFLLNVNAQQPVPPQAGFGNAKFVDFPISPFTGTFSYSVPVGTVTASSLSLPVSIDYHSGGNKVGDVPSNIGLGWYLNYGGSISLNVKGLQDDNQYNGYWYDPTPSVETLNNTMMHDVANGQMDGEPDIYTWKAGKYGGKFYIDRNGEVKHIMKTTCKIKYTKPASGPPSKITIVLENGDIYKYIIGLTHSGTIGSSGYILEKVLSYDKKDSIVLNYTDFHGYYFDYLAMPIKYGLNPNNMTTENNNNTTVSYSERYVESIVGFGNEIQFVNGCREDLGFGVYCPLKLNEIHYNNGDFCINYKLEQDYFQAESGGIYLPWNKRRLKLKSVQKLNCEYPEQFHEPPLVFEYYGYHLSDGAQFFPGYLDKNIDHFGFYNGANNNFPECNMIEPTTLNANGYTFNYGNANRDPNFNAAIIGMLKKITLPTKGTIEYTYEPNDYSKPSNSQSTIFNIYKNCTGSCNGIDNANYSYTMYISQSIKNTGFLSLWADWEDDCDGNNFNCSEGFPRYAEIKIYNSNSQLIYSYSLPTLGGSNTTLYLSDINNLIPDNDYTFEVNASHCYAECYLNYVPSITVEAPGIRLKQIKVSDVENAANDIIKSFTYTNFNDSSQSSGFIIHKPKYGTVIGADNSDDVAVFNSFSLYTLNDIDGFAIGYENVKIDYNGIGTEKLTYDKNIPTTTIWFPTIPIQVTKTGNTVNTEIRDNSNHLVKSTSANYLETNSNSDWFHMAHRFNMGYLVAYTQASYQLKTLRWNRVTSETTTLDGVTNTTTYTYNTTSDPPILTPTESLTSNSDGKTTKLITKFTSQYALNSSIKDILINKNINVPYETIKYVDNILVDGTRTQYNLFNNIPRPKYKKRYERTWNISGQLGSGYWKTQRKFYSYNNIGKPYRYKDSGSPYTYLYYDDNMNLSSMRIGSHTMSYDYYPNSNLLKTITDIEGKTVSYKYDELLRLKEESDDCKQITKTYNYYFSPQGNSSKHKVTEIITFGGQNNNNSNLGTITNITYFDNLNREIQKIRKGQSSSFKDIATTVEYDNFGRVIKEYLPIESSNNSGNFIPTQSNWKYNLKTYENSPLSRIISKTPPDWYAITYDYSTNRYWSDGIIKDYKNNTNYLDNSLYKFVTTDQNNNKSATFTDKKGRIIMTAVYDGTTIYNSTNCKKTYYIYDLKDRLESVIVPGATDINTDLNYYYAYNGKDSIVYKKEPSKGEMYYEYNNKNLLATLRDNNMGSSKCMAYTYDYYGRLTKTGFASYPTNVNNPAFSEQHTEIIYGTGNEKGKIKTTRTRILGTNDWLQSTNNFDDCGRLISTYGNNQMNISSMTSLLSSYEYDKGDNLTDIEYIVTPSSGGPSVSVKYIYKYDHIGRNTENLFSYNNGTPTTLSKKHFNHKEELITKYQGKTGMSGVNEYLQEINYQYLSNGLLKRINQGQTSGITHYFSCTNPNPTNYSTYNDKDLFYLELYYNSTISGSGGQIRKNGDISAVRWQTKGRSYQNYVYSYDYSGQLLEGKYYDYFHGPNQLINNNKYTENVTYDKRGNILTLNRYGVVGSESCNSTQQFDQMTYNYAGQTGNRIKSISDAKPNTSGAKEFKSAIGNYSYDLNGNIVSDPYKGIIQISYNHFNKPTLIEKKYGAKIAFIYDGNGSLLTRLVYDIGSSLIEKRDYIGNFEYVNGVLESVRHSEGRYKSVSGSFRHEYVMKDNLGNTRLVYSDLNNNGRIDVGSGEIFQESHYYPFGMEFSGNYWKQSGFDYKYKFNGIERIKDLGLDIDIAAFRSHDPVIGRWMQTDPLAAMTPQLNSYRFGMNNPVNYTDHLGLFGTRGDAENFLRDNREFLDHSNGEWSVGYSDVFGLYTVTNGTNTIMDYLDGFGPTYILPSVVILDNYNGGGWYEQKTKNTLIKYETGKDPVYQFIVPQNYGSWGQPGSDGYIWIGCLSCHAYNGAYRYAAFNSQERWIGKSIGETFLLFSSFMIGGATERKVVNPFEGKTFSQIDKMFKEKGFTTKGPSPLTGKGSYFSKSGTRYYLDKGGMYKKGFESPHVDIWYKGHPSYEKVKYFLDGSPKMYTPLK